MALPSTEAEWVTDLSLRHDAEKKQLREYDDEYELRSPLSYMHPEILRELGDRLQQVVIAWPMLVVDSVDERLDVEGFQLPDQESGDKDLWRVWQANSADEESQLAHVDALTMRRSYICVGANEEDADTPLITYESPLEVYADIDPRNRRVRAALRRWCDYQNSDVRLPETYATLYLPDQTVYYELTDGRGGMREIDRAVHKLGRVPVVPMINRARLSDRRGRSEFDPVLPLARAANKSATDMMVAAEFVAIPLRGLWGIGPDDLQDQNGNKLTALQAIMGRLLAIPEEGGREFQFPAADLTNFHKTVNLLANLVASISGLDPNDLGVHTDSPASAEAIAGRKERAVKRAERKQRAFGGAHEAAMRLVRRIQDGNWDPKYQQLATIWRDASTPTRSSKADAAVKLRTVGITTVRQAREDVGYSQVQIARMEAEDEAQAQRQPLAVIARGMAEGQSQTEPVDAGAVA